MTNWTDLIDTDPVRAAKAWERHCYDVDSPEAFQTIEEMYDGWFQDTRTLVSNLAALAEALAKDLAGTINDEYAFRGETTWQEQIAEVMEDARNPDSTPRFPKVK